MPRQPRIEIVRSDAEQPFHVRIVAANNRTLFSSENYSRRDSAMKAIVSLATAFGALDQNGWVDSIREVDERDPNVCDCGHPWAGHQPRAGCLGGQPGLCACTKEEAEPEEIRHCAGCGEDYNAFDESHVGHEGGLG